MRKVLTSVAIVLIPACWSQTLPEAFNPLNSSAEGIHLYGVSATSSYSTFHFPQNTGENLVNANSDLRYGINGAAGWQRLHGSTNFSVRYSGSYNRDARQSNLSNLNHSLVAGINRMFGPKWQLNITATGEDIAFEQFIFQPSALGALSQSNAPFSNLAASMSVGQFTDPQSGLLLSGSTAGAASPTQAILLGSQVLTYSVQSGLSYEHSSRLSFHFASFAVGGMHRLGNNIPGYQSNYLLPRTLGGDAGVSVRFSLSPRTDLDWTVGQSYTRSRDQKATGTTATFGFGRKMGRNWFLRAYTGGFFTETLQQSAGTPLMKQVVGGGSFGFHANGNTLLASYTRSGYDLTGGGLGLSQTISGGWSWRQRRGNWGLNASYERTTTSNPGFSNISGWQAAAGFSRRMVSNILLNLNYTYLDSQGVYLAISNHVTVNGVRLSLSWSPHLRETMGGAAGEPDQQQ